MKWLLILILFHVFSCGRVLSQSIEFGLRDTQFAKLGYVLKNNVYFNIEQSLLNVKMKEQSGCFHLGYRQIMRQWDNDICLYAGTEYSGRWHKLGAYIQSCYVFNNVFLTGVINTNYDSGLDFQFNYDIDVGYTIGRIKKCNLENLIVNVSFGNIPEFRDNVNNLRVGAKIISGGLWVQPEVSIPGINKNVNYIRVLCNFGWRIYCR